jgi:hypothetical protein
MLAKIKACFSGRTGVWLHQRAQDTKWAEKMRADFLKFDAAVRKIEASSVTE